MFRTCVYLAKFSYFYKTLHSAKVFKNLMGGTSIASLNLYQKCIVLTNVQEILSADLIQFFSKTILNFLWTKKNCPYKRPELKIKRF